MTPETTTRIEGISRTLVQAIGEIRDLERTVNVAGGADETLLLDALAAARHQVVNAHGSFVAFMERALTQALAAEINATSGKSTPRSDDPQQDGRSVT